jgi:hypothetical protein
MYQIERPNVHDSIDFELNVVLFLKISFTFAPQIKKQACYTIAIQPFQV